MPRSFLAPPSRPRPASARAAHRPTVVVVHGAFADASGFGAVTSRLQRRGYKVISPANPPPGTAARMASAQRPISLPAGQEKSTEPGWRTIPSWYLVGRQDQGFTAEAQRFMAKRAGARVTEINSSHVSYISHPGEVTKVIVRAARSVG